ncbi:rhomboid family intramembrane serine protease [Halobacillus andaensis]|uniref:rhomboid family intramembrane serine protease n=1 Tax=Halobacillus andaensis TaxID=1176239 RepID=UPI003D75DC9B
MFIQQEFYLWRLSYDLAVNQRFDIVFIDAQNSEIWLAKEQRGIQVVVRLVHKEINWRNELKREVDDVQYHISRNKHVFPGGRTRLHCVFISEYPPVDEWDSIEYPPAKHVKEVSVHFLDDSEKYKELPFFMKHFEISLQPYHSTTEEIEYERQSQYLKQQVMSIHKRRKKEFQEVFSYGKTVIIFVFIILNLIVFALMERYGASTSTSTLIEFGAKYNPAIIEGEWWRIITSMFLHIGIVHLLMNMLALFYLGAAVEKIYGSTRFLTIYFLAGIFGGSASFMLNPNIAAGASGAIFGLFGALLYFGLKNKRLFFQTMGYNLLMIIGINIAFGLIVPQIDNGAHIGGLAGGFIASMMVGLPAQPHLKRNKLVAVILYGFCMVVMLSIGIFKGDGFSL